MKKTRYTIEILASGQPRPYADHIYHVRVTFESVPWNSKTGELEPCFKNEEATRHLLRTLPCGFTENTPQNSEWYDTHLEWLKPIDGKPASEVITGGDPKQICASVWEFRTKTRYTD